MKSFLAQLALFVAAAAVCALGQAEPANIFDAKAAALEGRLHQTASAPGQAALLGQIYELRDLVDDRAALAQFFARAAANEQLVPLVRAEAARYTTIIARQQGDVTATPAAPSPQLLQQAQDAAASGDAAALESLARLEHDYATGTPLTHMLAAARARATAERWLLVARWSDDQQQVFSALTQALAAAPESAEVRLAFANYYAGRGQTHKALDLLAPLADSADFRARWRIAELEATLGRNETAAAEFALLQRRFPRPLWMLHHSAERAAESGHLQLAQTLWTALLAEDHENREARAQLAGILQRRLDTLALHNLYEEDARLFPADAEVQHHLAALNGDPGDLAQPTVSAANDDEQYLVDVSKVAREAQREGIPSAEEAVSLAEVRIERIAPSGLETRRVQELLLITSEAGARAYATREIQYAPASEELKLLHARVFKRDGRRLDGTDAGERNVADTSVSMYYDARTRLVRFRNLQPGDVIELDYRTTPHAQANPYGAFLGELVPFQASVPQRLQRYVVIAPADAPLHVASERMPEPKVTEIAGVRRYEWQTDQAAALPREPKGPSLTEVAPYVHVSAFASWQDLGRWYAALVRPQLAVSDEMRAALAQVLRGAKDDAAKIQAIHQLVLKQTHYVALEFGVYGYKPYPVAQTFARRFGDCKDKASLMIALLREAGIDADLALVRTRRLGDVSAAATSVAIFDHAIVYVPKYDLWLDGTAEYSGSRELPLEDQGAMALTVALDGSAAMRRIPAVAADDNYTRRTVSAELRSDGELQFSGSAYTRGEDAPGLRREYEIPERQRDTFRAGLAEVLPAVQVEDVDVEGAHNLEDDVTVNFRGTLDSFAGRKSVALASTWLPRSYVQTLAPLERRSQPLVLAAPWTTEEELHFTLPKGARVLSLPDEEKIAGDFGEAHLTYELKGRELRVKTRVQFRVTRIQPQEYPQFRQFCAQVERAFRDEIKVVLP